MFTKPQFIAGFEMEISERIQRVVSMFWNLMHSLNVESCKKGAVDN